MSIDACVVDSGADTVFCTAMSCEEFDCTGVIWAIGGGVRAAIGGVAGADLIEGDCCGKGEVGCGRF